MANGYINMISWNINRCGSHIKSRKVLAYLKSKNTDIVFIQLHLMGNEEAVKFHYDSSYSSKRNGEMILINNKSFVMLKQYNDMEPM